VTSESYLGGGKRNRGKKAAEKKAGGKKKPRKIKPLVKSFISDVL
jgi:hypothetical protein